MTSLLLRDKNLLPKKELHWSPWFFFAEEQVALNFSRQSTRHDLLQRRPVLQNQSRIQNGAAAGFAPCVCVLTLAQPELYPGVSMLCCCYTSKFSARLKLHSLFSRWGPSRTKIRSSCLCVTQKSEGHQNTLYHVSRANVGKQIQHYISSP